MVWPNFFLMNVFFALKGSKLFTITSALSGLLRKSLLTPCLFQNNTIVLIKRWRRLFQCYRPILIICRRRPGCQTLELRARSRFRLDVHCCTAVGIVWSGEGGEFGCIGGGGEATFTVMDFICGGGHIN